MPRRPGITFETETPSPPETAPHMDVAAFVGFASRGPIDVPVPVDDLARFRDVFGPPLELVSDRETGRVKRAHLHRAVEAFFRNEGRRCWVVRVAQPARAGAPGRVDRSTFAVPGLVSADAGHPPAIRARCYGATFDAMRVGTVLRRRLLPDPATAERAGGASSEEALSLSWAARSRDPLGDDQLGEDDLLRLHFARVRVEVDLEGDSLSGPGRLLTLDGTLRKTIPDPVPLRLANVRLVTRDGDVLTPTAGRSEANGVTVTQPEIEGPAGASKRLPVRIEGGEEIVAYGFDVPAEALSMVGLPDVIVGENTLTPNTAAVERRSVDDRLLAFAPVASRRRAAATEKDEETGPSVEVETAPARFYARVPVSLDEPGTDLEVEVEIRSPGDSPDRSLADAVPAFTVRRVGGPEEGDRLVLTKTRPPENEAERSAEEEGARQRVPAADLEGRVVHVHADGVEGWLQLGQVARRQETNEGGHAVTIEVREALWPTDRSTVFGENPLPPLHGVERHRFDLLAWEAQELQARLDRLGFASSHPRGWTRLPADDELFGLEEGEAAGPEPETLSADVFEPRFPFAGPSSADDLFVPLGMADRPEADRTGERLPPSVPRSRLERERLARFSPEMFVDEELVGTSTALLEEEADQMVFVDEEPVSGLHSLWPVREATLLALPDAVHRGWDTPRPVTPDALSPPSALTGAVDSEPDPPVVHLTWSVDRLGEDGIEVEVQEAREPTFSEPVVRYRGTDPSVDRYVRSNNPVTLFFRYRVVADDRPGPWSNTVSARLPVSDFDSCMARPGVPRVTRVGDHWVSWKPLPPPADRPLTYELQIGRTPAFDAPSERSFEVLPPAETPPEVETIGWYEPTDLLPRSWYKVPDASDAPAVRYVRLRARRDTGNRTVVGGWSNTVVFVRDLEQKPSFIPPQEYDDPTAETPGGGREALLDLQRAMLRFGAARGDVLSVLSLPRHDQADDARRHVDRLQTPGAVLNADEMRTLSYGALYYPWLLGPVDGGARIVSTPPDGAACGMVANRTLRDGAWRAPANEPLAAVSTVVPPLRSADRAELETSPINVFAEAPDGVLTLGTATLARDPDLEPITTRRLLSLIRRVVRREGPALVFENHTPLLRRRIAEQLDDLLRPLFDRGAFAGATPSEGYRIVVDDRVNPPRQVERGRLVVELRVAPARPLTFLTVRLVQRSGQRPTVRESGGGAVV